MMKPRCFFLVLTASVLLMLGSLFTGALAENVIRQTLLDSGVTCDLVTDSDSGSSLSALPIGEGGACYELYARGTAWDNRLYFLDRKVVGFYLPQASISVTSEDTWSYNATGIPVTRADKPFTLAIRVWGLSNDASAPLAAREVLYTRVGQNFNATYVPEGNPEYTIASLHMGNVNPSYTPVYTGLQPMPSTKAMGMEQFTLSSLPDETVPTSSILAEGRLLIWPVSQAAITGISNESIVRDNLPGLVIQYRDLYPVSLTYAQIYSGSAELGKVGTVISGSLRWHYTTVPQNEVIAVENWENLIPLDGTYTIEVIHMTPFDNWATERLTSVTFLVDRKVIVRGQVTTLER